MHRVFNDNYWKKIPSWKKKLKQISIIRKTNTENLENKILVNHDRPATRRHFQTYYKAIQHWRKELWKFELSNYQYISQTRTLYTFSRSQSPWNGFDWIFFLLSSLPSFLIWVYRPKLNEEQTNFFTTIRFPTSKRWAYTKNPLYNFEQENTTEDTDYR